MRRPRTTPTRRSGFTLLEVILSSMIAVLLMAALYVAVDVQLRHAQTGRDVIEQSTLARALLNRIASDIAPNIGPVLPTKPSSSGSAGGAGAGGQSGATGGGASSPTASTGSGSGSAMGSTSSGGSTSSSSPAAAPASGMAAPVFNLGVQGDSGQLILSVSRVPRELNWFPDSVDTPQGVSDLRFVCYWLAGGTDSPLGLARQSIKVVTGDVNPTLPLDTTDEANSVIAEEVKSLQFSYFNGTDWVDTWDGTQPGSDGMTPMGPPLAIAVTIGVLAPGSTNPDQGLKYYRHVVAIPTANGLPSQTTSTTGSSQ